MQHAPQRCRKQDSNQCMAGSQRRKAANESMQNLLTNHMIVHFCACFFEQNND